MTLVKQKINVNCFWEGTLKSKGPNFAKSMLSEIRDQIPSKEKFLLLEFSRVKAKFNDGLFFHHQKEDIMKILLYVSIEEVKKVCKDLKISDWTKKKKAKVSFKEANTILIELNQTEIGE